MPKAAIVGCGFIAGRHEDFAAPETYSHAKAYRRNPAFVALALVDRSRANAEALAAKAGAEVFGTTADMLTRFRPDVVSLCTPDDDHAGALTDLLTHPAAPRLVLCEKPVCRTRAEFLRLREIEKTGRTRVIVNHSRRFDPAHQALKTLIAGGSLGALVQGHVDYYGGWRHLGVHIVDVLQFLFDRTFEPKEIAYCCPSKYADDPTLHVLGVVGGALVRMTGFPEEYFQILDITLLFERGQVRIGDFGQTIEVWRKTVNAAGENVLARDAAASGRGMKEPIVHAAALVARYLASGDAALLEPYGLAEAGRTMETLWKGAELRAA